MSQICLVFTTYKNMSRLRKSKKFRRMYFNTFISIKFDQRYDFNLCHIYFSSIPLECFFALRRRLIIIFIRWSSFSHVHDLLENICNVCIKDTKETKYNIMSDNTFYTTVINRFWNFTWNVSQKTNEWRLIKWFIHSFIHSITQF